MESDLVDINNCYDQNVSAHEMMTVNDGNVVDGSTSCFVDSVNSKEIRGQGSHRGVDIDGNNDCNIDDKNSCLDSACGDSLLSDDKEIFPCHPAPPLEIKLFVGRIPRTFTEDNILPIFEEFGKVVNVSIIRDKNNMTHKGSAFVRMSCIAQADAAVRALNNQKVLDETLGPLQVKYATGEAEKLGIADSSGEAGLDQAKLFIGSIPKTMNEDEVKEFFSPYGQVDEIYIMKDINSGIGKGCAFVKYAYKEQAIHAVKCLDRKHTFEGCSRPIEVRFAESRTQRQQTQQQPTRSVPASSAVQVHNMIPPSGVLGVPPTAMRAPILGANPVATAYAAASPYSQIQAAVPRQAGVWKEYFNHDGRPYYHNEATNVTQWDTPPDFDQQAAKLRSMTCPVTATGPAAVAYLPALAANGVVGARPAMGTAVGGPVSQDIATGPTGANIFVFHVPPEWTHGDLLAAFSPFGNVISARIATDKSADNKTKGYAFVSYDNVSSAASAVNHMNGFVWGGKKLKVTIKKGEEHAAQHLLMPGGGGVAVGTTSTALMAARGLYGAAVANAMGGYSGSVSSSTTTQDTTAGAAQPGTMATAVPGTVTGGYGMCNGNNLSNQVGTTNNSANQYALPQGLAQYNLQAAAAAQYGTYGFGRYAPY